MSVLSFLRRIWWPRGRPATSEDAARAATENALIDNDRAFQRMHEAYGKVPEANATLQETIRRSTTPFADLENLMHGDARRARR